MLRCPKLTRYKLMSGGLLAAFSLFLMLSTVTRMNEVHIRHGSKDFTFFSVAFYGSSDNFVPLSQENLSRNIINNCSGYNISGISECNLCSGYISNYAVENSDESQLPLPISLKRRLPSAIVIGARKAGTRALLRFINLHPDVAASRQETHFFDRYFDQGLDWYRDQMPYSLETQLTVEKTPSYFVDWMVPERVYNFNSSIKLILIVRNPIDRAVSDYVQLKHSQRRLSFKYKTLEFEKFYKSGHGEYFGSFEELAFDRYTGEINKSYAPIKRSLYCRHLEKWLNHFQLSQMLVIDGENIKVRPWEEMYKLEEFLGLSHQIGKDRFVYNETKGFYCVRLEKRNQLPQTNDQASDLIMWSEQCLADSKGRDHPVLQRDVRQQLLNFFQPFNNRFFMRVSQTFDWK
ncbi:unnamed protein product [Candidula unifasciata]|uniref:Sulfotransferase domain-containing protein n=1 Tax=Candidula unifasciata TaxID=100452 RepID=A0A8S3Z4H4_9EUPU|nr:unnamed protein product [Candidula unifasciata]